MNTMTMYDDKMLYDEDKDDEWWWHLLVQVAAPYRKGVVSNMGRSQIYIQCSTLIRHCWHHHHHLHHLLGDNLWVKALNEGWMCSRLCLTVLGSHPQLPCQPPPCCIHHRYHCHYKLIQPAKNTKKCKNLLVGISLNSFVATTPSWCSI